MYLVDRIIERCENSSRDWREGVTGGRTLRITQEDYDACGKEELIEEVQRLERAGLLTVKKWVVPDSDVELVAYQVEHLPDFYRLADSESGEEYWPKQAKVNYYIRMIDQELSEGFQKEWIENYLEKLKERIIFSTDKDLRFYLMQYIEKKGTLNPRALNQWKFIPEEWVKPAAERDYEYLFGTK